MKKSLLFFLMFLSSMVSFSSEDTSNSDIKTYKYTFSKQDHFNVSYADYPSDQDEFYELDYKNGAKLPREINTHHPHGLKISGNNHSDDLFMYAYKKIPGLKPNTQYHVSFSLEFASNAPVGSSGVGGSPGDSIFVKIGAVNIEPQRFIDTDNYYKLALDKGNQKQDGKDMILIGTVGVDTQDSIYRLKTLPYIPNPELQEKLAQYTVTTDNQGQAWVVFGTDSGFEATSTFFYTNLSITFKEQSASQEM
jgi:hypothetical protein